MAGSEAGMREVLATIEELLSSFPEVRRLQSKDLIGQLSRLTGQYLECFLSFETKNLDPTYRSCRLLGNTCLARYVQELTASVEENDG
jgi:hypothetical protein